MKKIYLTGIMHTLMIGLCVIIRIPVYAQTLPPGESSSGDIDASIVTQINDMHRVLNVPDAGLGALNGNGPKVGDGCASIVIARNNAVRANQTNPHEQKAKYEDCLNEIIARVGQTNNEGQGIACGRAQQFLPLQRSSSPDQKPLCCINGIIVGEDGQPVTPAGETGDLPQGKCLATSTQDTCLAVSNLLLSLHKAASTVVCGISQSFLNQASTQHNADNEQKKAFSDLVTRGNTFVTEQATKIQQQLTALTSLEGFAQCTGADSQANAISSLLTKRESVRQPLVDSNFTGGQQAHTTACQNTPAPFSLSLSNCTKQGDNPGDILVLFTAVMNVRKGLIPSAFAIGDPLRILKMPLPNPNNFVSILQGPRQEQYKQAQDEIIKTSKNTSVPVTQAITTINNMEQAIRSYPSNLRRFLELGADLHAAYCEAQLDYSVEGSEGLTKGGGSCQDAIGQYFANTSTVDETLEYRQKNLDDAKIRLANAAATYVSRNEKKEITIPNITTCTMEEIEKNFGGSDKVTASIKAALGGLVQECQMYETLIKTAKEKLAQAQHNTSNTDSGNSSTSQNTEQSSDPQTQQTTNQQAQKKTDEEILREVEDLMIQHCQEQSCIEITPLGMCCTEGQRGANNGICYPSALVAPNGEFCAAGVTKEGTCVANHWGDMGIQCSPQQLLIGACSFRTYDALQIRASNKDPSPKVFIQDIILSLTSFIGVVATLSLMRSGFKAIMAGYDNGNEYNTAIKNAGYSVIGLLLAGFSYAIVRIIQYVAMAGG